ncbi:hypothetical protein QQX98_008038 [Neonectria punicea]|uniref:FAD-binding domain-containing protein n=1 Tax=Neonectria punicea TaxID=979145 RepID=A0ABR1GWA5_9HYPO
MKPEHAGPYLQYLKTVSSQWPQLRLLADFMEVGTDPLRWRNFYGDDKKNGYTYPDDPPEAREQQQSDRVSKTHVHQLEYLGDRTINLVGPYTNPQELGNALNALSEKRKDEGSTGAHVKFRLFIVEDLSREVIERPGFHFDIDPDFFRAHIFDYAWFNIRDPFWNPPSLHMDITRKNRFQIRFCRARYFSSPARFDEGQDAVNKFNIGRKLYEDENKAYWDRDPTPEVAEPQSRPKVGPTGNMKTWFTALSKSISKHKTPDVEAQPERSEGIDGKVGLMRTNATFWKKEGGDTECDVGVLLLDPTIKEGFPLWQGYRNWDPIPSARTTPTQLNSCVPSLTRRRSKSTPEASFFKDFLYWAQRPDVVLGDLPATASDVHRIPALALLRLVCAEWLNLSQYIKTRLSQVDWEITHPKEFLTQTQIDTILNKLHTWRRLVPLYREMLLETKSRVFQHLDHARQSSNVASPDCKTPDPLDTYKDEFTLLLGQMKEYEERIDRLTTVVTSALSIMMHLIKVIIIGTGPAGLLAALRLKEHHQISSVVYELRQETTTLGGAIAIPSNGLRLLHRLGLYDRILAKGAETSNLVLHSLKGKTMGEMSMISWSKERTGFGYVRIRRADIMDVLLDAAEKASIPVVYGKKLQSIEENDGIITALFINGTHDTADFLLGCDGIHSSVRKLYVDPECVPEYSGISNAFSLLPTDDLPPSASSLDNLNATLTPDGLFGIPPATPSRDLLYWFFSREITLPVTGGARDGWEQRGKKEVENWKSTLLSLFGDEESEWMDILREIVHKPEVIKFYPIYKVPPGRPWSKGRCLIIGDAAHAMPPHASQGVSMALEDVFLFSKLLQSGGDDVEAGLRTYEKRKARTEKMLKAAEQNGKVRQKITPWRLWATELAISGGLWVYNAVGLDKFGLGQGPLAYDIDEERF